MKSIRNCQFIMVPLLLAWATAGWSQSEWQVMHTFQLKEKPADMVVSADKRQIFILTDKGRIMIYGANGQIKDTIDVGESVDQIKVGPDAETLFLLSRKTSSIKMIRISTSEEIDTSNAPYKGKANADVTVVVFSDFQ